MGNSTFYLEEDIDEAKKNVLARNFKKSHSSLENSHN
jgi:hypothetical protein